MTALFGDGGQLERWCEGGIILSCTRSCFCWGELRALFGFLANNHTKDEKDERELCAADTSEDSIEGMFPTLSSQV